MLAYLSKNADKRIFDALKQEGFEIFPLAPFCALSAPTDTHADMLLASVDDKIFKHADYLLEGEFFNVDEPINNSYPNDVLLNIAVVGRNVLCNEKHASGTVLAYLRQNGYNIIHVAQGYAHCSCCIVSDNAIITSDKGIAAAAQRANIDTLLISPGNIELPPYDHGFIGGASGSTEGAIYFCGSLKYHPNGNSIKEFINVHGKNVIELSDSPLQDVGGILFK